MKPRWVGPLPQAWYNLGDGPDHKKLEDLDELRDRGALIIGLAEAGDRGRMLEDWCVRRNGRVWALYDGDGSPGSASTPILVHPDVVPCIARWITEEAVPARDVGDPGAGPARMKRKVTNGVKVRRRRRVGVWRPPSVTLTAHLLPSATRDNLPNAEKRQRIFRTHIHRLLATARRFKIAKVTILGDFNAELDDPLMAELREAGYRAAKTGPTHGAHRRIDLALARRELDTLTVALSSDHRGLIATRK